MNGNVERQIRRKSSCKTAHAQTYLQTFICGAYIKLAPYIAPPLSEAHSGERKITYKINGT